MRAVKSKDTTPELQLRRALHAEGLRYRLHKRDLPGTPDITFPGLKKAIFVHGCFWHGHDCPHGRRTPKTNVDYWTRKIARNQTRDRRTALDLKQIGWKALTIWECELKHIERSIATVKRFLDKRAHGHRGAARQGRPHCPVA